MELRRHLELNRNAARVFSRGENTRDEGGFFSDDSRSRFKRKRAQYDRVDNPRILLLLEITLPLQ